jgi:hypothetical protein
MSNILPIYTHILARLREGIVSLIFSTHEAVPDYTPVDNYAGHLYYIVIVDKQLIHDYMTGGLRYDRHFEEIVHHVQPLSAETILEINDRLMGIEKYPTPDFPKTIYEIAYAIFNA